MPSGPTILAAVLNANSSQIILAFDMLVIANAFTINIFVVDRSVTIIGSSVGGSNTSSLVATLPISESIYPNESVSISILPNLIFDSATGLLGNFIVSNLFITNNSISIHRLGNHIMKHLFRLRKLHHKG